MSNEYSLSFTQFTYCHFDSTSACSPIVSESSTPPSSVEQFGPSFTETSEQALIATEQAMAMAVKTEGALDSAAQPTFTPQPTQTSTIAHLPTLTPIPNSTPSQKALSLMSPDVLAQVTLKSTRLLLQQNQVKTLQKSWEP